jgi:hypothetical protein
VATGPTDLEERRPATGRREKPVTLFRNSETICSCGMLSAL